MAAGWRALYPFESRYFDRGDGVRLHYVDEGKGEAVVLVHGNPTWSFYFRELVKDLRRDRRALAVDHVGMGLSDCPDEGRYRYTLSSRVEDLEKLLEARGIREDVTLVVHDWGGMIGLAWAARHPERVARLVVLNTAGFLPPWSGLPWQLRLARSPLGAVAVRGLNAFVRGAARSCAARRPLSPAVKEGLAAPYGSWARRLAVHRFVQDIPEKPGDPAYELCRQTGERLALLAQKPALLIWGMKDFVFDGRFLAEFKRRLPQAESRQLADCGHFVLEDAPEEIVPLVRDFLGRHPVPAAGAAR